MRVPLPRVSAFVVRMQLSLVFSQHGPNRPLKQYFNDYEIFQADVQGPISSTSLRRVFVLKTSYEVRTLKIGFHQTIELCELLTFCRIFKTNI